MTARNRTPEPPYCWQNKNVRRAIRERMNGNESTSATLSLYDALTEIASNEGCESFRAGQPHIGEIAGLSARSVRRLEPILEEIGAVGICRPQLRGHHTYTLLTIGQGGPTLGQECNQASCPPVEEKQKQQQKEHKKNKGPKIIFDPRTAQLPFSSAQFAMAWGEWCSHRAEIRRPLTETSTSKQLSSLSQIGESRAIAAISQSITSGWQGIFEPKADNKAKQTTTKSHYDTAWT